MAAPVKTWGSPEENQILVDDVKALKQAVHDEMELIGCGFHQHRVVTILGFGNVADAVEILAIGYILTVYEESEGEMTSWQSSFLTAAVFVGMLGGGLVGGVAGDFYGRKPVLLTTLAINAIAAFLSAFSPNIYWLIFFRAMAGVGVGGVVASLFALCLEHVPVSARGRYVTILCSFWMFGAVLTAGTAWVMLGKYSNGERILELSWRWFAGVVGLPSFTCFVLALWYVPESPHFLASKGDAQGATTVLQYIHRVHQSGRHIEFKFTTVDDADNDKDTKMARKMEGGGRLDVDSRSEPDTSHSAVCSRESFHVFARLFERPNAGPTLLLMLCGFSLSFGSYGLSTWITKLFQSAGLENPFENAFLFAGANLPGNIVSLYLIDIIGHQRLLSGSLFMSGFCALLFAFNIEGSKTVIVLVSCLFNACTTAAWNGFGVLSAENFPQELRTTGISVVNGSNRVAAITAQFVNGFLMGPPPHLEALLLVTTTVMCTGGFASRWIAHGGDDDIDAISKSDSCEDVEADPEGSPSFEGEHAGLIRHDVLLNEKKHSPKREVKNGAEGSGKQLVQRAAIDRPSVSD
ncbi:Synaptic vesicle 2-related protein [Phytophthora citrophthora]|uniref:Synaptic vesicle 2-related protein n=1 Tax=Phytophthora citrophthora TaxID=4793 RepID=A0AAD9GZI2_9STRA|nr:Synaptic vesicle 2-related protein [Phytophthora citrophthora]